MSQARIEKLLETRIGLSADTIGSDVIAKAVQKRRNACAIETFEQYVAFLQRSTKEWDELVEAVLVPETWFFRNKNSFLFLAEYVRTEWIKKADRQPLRLLSIPCSSGEEPYSIAITLFELGLSQRDFQLDAVDLSRKSLQKALIGDYGRESFRGAQEFSFRDRFFTRHGMSYQIHHMLKDAVNFMQGNLLELETGNLQQAYDVIFCRNLLIYLGESAKIKTIQTLDRLLTEKGVLFVGHAERSAFKGLPFLWISQPGVFACRRAKEESISPESKQLIEGAAPRPSQGPLSSQTRLPPENPRFERRSTERFVLKPDAARRAKAGSPEKPYTGVERRKAENANAKRLEMARQLADQGKLDEALEQCERVLKQNPANVQAYFLKGLIFQALRNEKKAEEFLNKTLYLSPNHYEALSYLRLIAEHRGDRKKAERLKLRMERIQET